MSTEVSSLQRHMPAVGSGVNSSPTPSRVSAASASVSEKSVEEASETPEGQNVTAPGQVAASTVSEVGVQAAEEEKEQAGEGDTSEVNEAVNFVNSQEHNLTRNLQFSVEEDTGEVVVRVYDSETEELVRQIPSEDMMELARRLQEQSQEQDETSSNSVEGLLLKVTA